MCVNEDVSVCQCRCVCLYVVKCTLTSSRCSTVVPTGYFQMVICIAVLYCIFDNAGLVNFTDDCNVTKVKGSFRDGVDLPAGVK